MRTVRLALIVIRLERVRLKVALWFPCALFVGISLPFYEIYIVPTSLPPVPENLFDLVLAIIGGFGQRSWFPLNRIVRSTLSGIEYGMECSQLGQAKFSLLNLVILLILSAKFSLSPYKMYGAY